MGDCRCKVVLTRRVALRFILNPISQLIHNVYFSWKQLEIRYIATSQVNNSVATRDGNPVIEMLYRHSLADLCLAPR